jgi:hypothetical protein
MDTGQRKWIVLGRVLRLTVDMMVRSIETRNCATMIPIIRHTRGNPVAKSDWSSGLSASLIAVTSISGWLDLSFPTCPGEEPPIFDSLGVSLSACLGEGHLSIPWVSPMFAADGAGFKGRFAPEDSVTMGCDGADGGEGGSGVSFDGRSNL